MRMTESEIPIKISTIHLNGRRKGCKPKLCWIDDETNDTDLLGLRDGTAVLLDQGGGISEVS